MMLIMEAAVLSVDECRFFDLFRFVGMGVGVGDGFLQGRRVTRGHRLYL